VARQSFADHRLKQVVPEANCSVSQNMMILVGNGLNNMRRDCLVKLWMKWIKQDVNLLPIGGNATHADSGNGPFGENQHSELYTVEGNDLAYSIDAEFDALDDGPIAGSIDSRHITMKADLVRSERVNDVDVILIEHILRLHKKEGAKKQCDKTGRHHHECVPLSG
jgi:hypothetical protein